MTRIFVVDDDPAVRDMLADYLATQGYTVALAADGGAFDAALAAGPPPDLVVLDVGLPGESGFGIARRLREHHDIGIVMLTGAGDVVDRVVGLEVGADDYLAKPVSLPELGARIAAVLRRRSPVTQRDDMLAFGPYRLDMRAFELRDAQGRTVPLGPMEIDLVAAFASNPGKALSREDLLRLAPPRDGETFDRSIDHRITRLRRKLEENAERPQLIKTVRGVGYLHPAGPSTS